MVWKKVGALKVISAIIVVAGGAVFFQQCAQVKFQTLSAGTTPSSPINPSGSSCVPTVAVAPQLTFVPSSFQAGQSFSVTVAQASSYSSISIDFGDGTAPVTVGPSSSGVITHTYSTNGSYSLTTKGTDATCQSTFTNTQSVNVSACLPQAATLNTSLNPTVPQIPAPVAPFQLIATISNAGAFQSSSSDWYLNRSATPLLGGANTTLNLAAGNYVLQAQATDTCGMTRMAPAVNFCVASAGSPTVTIQPSAVVAGTSTTFSVFNPGNYASISINFGDGSSGTIATSGTSAGTITHTYASAQSIQYIISVVDSCGSSRVNSYPLTVAAGACVATQPDGCVNGEFCTGRTSCNLAGTCASACGLCGYTGTPVQPSVTCTGTQSCVAVGTSCSPSTSCSNVCGQCGYTGTPVSPVTSCLNDQVCGTGGTTCQPTQSCTTVPGRCGTTAPPSPTPTPGPSPTPGPGPSPTPSPGPSPTPAPGPSPSPGPSPTPSPGPTPTPLPGPAPSPSPTPSPSPVSNPPSCMNCAALCGGAAFVAQSCMIDDATCPTGFCGYADQNCGCGLGFNQCFCESRLPTGANCGTGQNCQSGNCVASKCK